MVVVTASSSQSSALVTEMQEPSFVAQALSDKGVNVTVTSVSAEAKKDGMSKKKKQLALALVLFIILVLSMGLLAKFLCCNGSEDKTSYP